MHTVNKNCVEFACCTGIFLLYHTGKSPAQVIHNYSACVDNAFLDIITHQKCLINFLQNNTTKQLATV